MKTGIKSTRTNAVILLAVAFAVTLVASCGQEGSWRTVKLTKDHLLKYRLVDSGTQEDLTSVSMLSNGTGYIAGDGNTIYKKNPGNSWLAINPPNGNTQLKKYNFSSVSVVNKNSAWFAGDIDNLTASSHQALLEHYNGKRFNSITTPNIYYFLSLSMVNDIDGWATGPIENTVLKYNGQKWNYFSVPGFISKIVFRGEREGWAIGGGLFHFQNGAWEQVEIRFSNPMNSLLILSNKSVMVGGVESLLSCSDNQLRDIPGFTGRSVLSMAECDGGDVILVGGNASLGTGKIMYVSNGEKLKPEIDFPQNYCLTGVSLDTPQHGWIVGRNGILIEFRIDH